MVATNAIQHIPPHTLGARGERYTLARTPSRFEAEAARHRMALVVVQGSASWYRGVYDRWQSVHASVQRSAMIRISAEDPRCLTARSLDIGSDEDKKSRFGEKNLSFDLTRIHRPIWWLLRYPRREFGPTPTIFPAPKDE